MTEAIEKPAAEPAAGTPEYDQMMAARFRDMSGRGEEQKPVEKPARPEHVPAKFWDEEKGEVRVEDMAKSYTELEKSRGAKPPEKVQIPEPKPGEDPAKSAVESAGLDWDKVQADVAANGALDDETIKTIVEKTGIPRAMIDNYMALASDASARETEKAIAHVGGQEQMDALMDWAGKSLTKPEIERYNQQLGTRDGWMTALDTLTMLRTKANPTSGEPSLVQAKGGTPTAGGYQSKAEMSADMAHPQYAKDPAFRAAVAEKMRTATWALDRQTR